MAQKPLVSAISHGETFGGVLAPGWWWCAQSVANQSRPEFPVYQVIYRENIEFERPRSLESPALPPFLNEIP